MSFNQFQIYVAERYGNYFEDVTEATKAYLKYMEREGIKVYSYPYGFFTAKKQGDAFIVQNLYTAKDSRAKGMAWALFYDIKRLAALSGANVIIGFSEHEGQNRHLGQAAMNAAGFVPYAETDVATLYIRGMD